MRKKSNVSSKIYLATINTFRLFPKGGIKANARLSLNIAENLTVIGNFYLNVAEQF